jgi:hypothetical protein
MQGFVDIKLTFFLGYDRFLVAGSNLDTYSSRMHFFSLVPETDDDMSDIGVGNTAAHEWLCAGG